MTAASKALADKLAIECKVREDHPYDYDADLTKLFRDCEAALRATPAPTTEPVAWPTQAQIITGAMAIATSRGHDPDGPAPLTEMCDEHNFPVPWWMVFVEESEACLKAAAPSAVVPDSAGIERATIEPVAWQIEVHGFVEAYNFCFEDGRVYTPAEHEKAMLEDAINGYIAECEQKQAELAASPVAAAPEDGVREALSELYYEFCKGLNDFRPDSRLGRKVREALAHTRPRSGGAA